MSETTDAKLVNAQVKDLMQSIVARDKVAFFAVDIARTGSLPVTFSHAIEAGAVDPALEDRIRQKLHELAELLREALS